MNLRQLPQVTNQTLRRMSTGSSVLGIAGYIAGSFVAKHPGVVFDIAMASMCVGLFGVVACRATMRGREIRAREQQIAADRQELEELRTYKAQHEPEHSADPLER